jgi:hypothetical protein
VVPTTRYTHLPLTTLNIDVANTLGPFEGWRCALGQGGINPLPLPSNVAGAVRSLKPRLIRIFLQEFFNIYPAHDRFDWSRLDPYMQALADTGAKVVAALTIKPPVLFPQVNHAIWRPNDVAEWQHVVRELVKRYSVERPNITHWEIGNETDIGESGGSPYLIPDPCDYAEYYEMTVLPIRQVFPEARVGGPAACWVDNEPLPGFVRCCRERGTPLDFISWHLYSDDPAQHATGVEHARKLLSAHPGARPEMMVTEWSKGFEFAPADDGGQPHWSRVVSVEDMAYQPRRAAITAASLIAMARAGLDWSFYYHIWDQYVNPADFLPFYSEKNLYELMLPHWNEVPHRFGLFGVSGEVRPQYFVFQMLSRMGDALLGIECNEPDVHAMAATGEQTLSVLMANYNRVESAPRNVELRLSNVRPGKKRLTVYRIDGTNRVSQEELALMPVEQRNLYARSSFRCQVFLPADSVALITLQDA